MQNIKMTFCDVPSGEKIVKKPNTFMLPFFTIVDIFKWLFDNILLFFTGLERCQVKLTSEIDGSNYILGASHKFLILSNKNMLTLFS